MLFGGVVGDATRTVSVIADENGRVLGYGVSGPSNYHIVGLDESIRNIRECLWDAFIRAESSIRELECITLGLAGIDTRKDRNRFTKAMDLRLPSRNILVRHDSETALAGALAGGPGVIVIADTGSVAAGLDENGRYLRCGGWGPFLGDEGSAYDLGKRALIEVLREYDGRGSYTILTSLIKEKFGIESVEDIIDIVYGNKIDVVEIASIAKLVIKAANEGDHIALSIIDKGAKMLAEMAATVIRRLYLEELERVDVAVYGMVFDMGDIFLEKFKMHLMGYVSNINIIVPRFPPCIGGLLVSYRFSGIEINEELLSNIENSIKRIPSNIIR